MEETEIGSERNAGIIAGAQKVEHYEIATYGTLAAFAKVLGHKEHFKDKRIVNSSLIKCEEYYSHPKTQKELTISANPSIYRFSIYCIPSKAPSKSPIKSSIFSIPTDILNIPGVIPEVFFRDLS